MTEQNDHFDLAAEREKLQAEVARLRVERDSGVPAELLAHAFNEEAARELAQALLAWKAAAAPAAPPPTAAAPAYSASQIGRDSLSHLSAEQVSQAHTEGRLEAIGAPAPQPRNGRP